MKYSMLLVAATAALAVSTPLQKRKIAIVYDVVTVTETVSAARGAIFFHNQHMPTSSSTSSSTSTSTTTSTTTTPPPPPPPPAAPSPPPAPAPAPEQRPSPQAAPAPAPVGTDYQSTALAAHNAHRRNHTAPDLTWDGNLEEYARQVAITCRWGHNL